MRKTRAILLAMVLTISIVASACGSGGSSGSTAGGAAGDSESGATGSTESTPVEDRDNITLTFLDYVPSPQREEFFERMMAGYMEERPYIDIEYGSVPYEEATAKLTTLAAAKDLPDVVNLHNAVVWTFAPAGWIAPLNEYIDAIPGYRDSFVEAITLFLWAEEEKTLGSIYTMPDGVMTNGIFIRKDWVEEAGLDLQELRENWTWETYIDTVYALTDPEQNRYGISYRGGPAGFDRLQQMLVSTSQGYDFDNEGNCLYYTPENVANVQKYINMYLDGCAPQDSVNWGFAEMVDNFTGGLTGTLCNDVEVVATCLERMDDDQWAVMPLPRSSIDGRIPSYAGSVYNYAVSAFSDNPEDAFGFIEYITRPDHNAEYCKMLTMMPVRKDVDDEFFSEDGPVYGFMTQIQDPGFTDQPAYGRVLEVAAFRETAHVEWQKVLMGERTVDEVLKEYDELLTEIAKTYLEENPGKQLGQLRTFDGEIPYDGPSGEH